MEDNPDNASIKRILKDSRVIAVVGLSADSWKDSHKVAAYLKSHGYRIIPVNPSVEEVLGEKSYPDLKSIPEKVDVVDVFRRPEHVPEIADDAIAINAKVLWMQAGIRNEEAAKRARQAGLTVIQDECMMAQHSRVMK
ncbi:MAG: CoA-binding protein [Desulfomonile tiedjei]|uniref:CoA-binding protein n=1 Tax=Desulfomonile tiedjei TaxID=2358 RepID=A0A9D6V177_9BACT|nr:CoA-binding protein [Desulfomonile tiedjei]